MSERRPHWDDELIFAVMSAAGDGGHLFIDDIHAVIAAVEDWARWEHVPKGTLRRLEQAEAVVQRVRELHREVEGPGFTYCEHCDDAVSGSIFDEYRWPCETIQALDGTP